MSTVLGLADAISDSLAAFSSAVASIDDANELNDVGMAVARWIPDVRYTMRRVTDAITETSLSGGVVAGFAHATAALGGAEDIATELDYPIVLRRH